MAKGLVTVMGTLPIQYTVLSVVLVPFYLVSLALALVLRGLASLYLSWTEPTYRGLLNVFDLFFDRDPPETRSNITVFSMIKLTRCRSIEDVRNEILKQSTNVLGKNDCVKMKCVIQEWLGFRYWQEVNVDVEKQVRMFKAETVNEVRTFVSKVSNERIYDDRMFEVYLGEKPINDRYPLIFKAHHSIADGYGIRNMIVDSSATAMKKPWTKRMREMKNLAVGVFNLIAMIFCAPLLCISQNLSPKDRNSLRAKKLSSKKQISWEISSFQKIKDIQQRTGYTFSEVILTAVSKTLDDVFTSRGESVPHVTLVFPHRRSRVSRGLENEFVLAPVRLPVHHHNNSSSSKSREAEVATACRVLDTTPSYRLNYFAPRFACLLFPAPLPRWTYESTEFTALVSNFPGPKNKVIFDGYEIESFFFVVPNIAENNGLGITMVSYDGQYTVACILDEAVARTPDDSQRITKGIVEYIDDTHAKLNSKDDQNKYKHNN